MPHKKGRRGQKKIKVREPGGVHYPARTVKCTANVAPRCKVWINENTMPAPGICKRCWQKMHSK